MTATLFDTLSVLDKLAPHFVASAVVDLKSGLPLVTYPKEPPLNIDAVCAFYRDVVASAAKASRTIVDPPAVDELVLSHDGRRVIIRPIRNYAEMVIVVVSSDCEMEEVRELVEKMAEEIEAGK